MGNGRSKLNKSGTSKVPKTLAITTTNAHTYGITLHRGKAHNLDKELIENRLQQGLDTINALQNLLGLKTNMLPVVNMYYMRESSTAYGDCRLGWGAENFDAQINLYNGMFRDKNYDTAAHEYVHALEAWIIKQNIPQAVDQINAWSDHMYADAICRNALVKVGAISKNDVFDKDIWKTHASTIKLNKWDTYASTKTAETLTRAVQEVLRRGNNASDYAKAVVASLKDEIQLTYKHMNKK